MREIMDVVAVLHERQSISEAVIIGDLIEQVENLIPATVRQFVQKKVDEWSRTLTGDRREQLGYNRYYDTIEGYKRENYWEKLPSPFKPFDAYDFEQANWKASWSVTDQIGNKLETLIPKEGSSPVYALMGVLSTALTKLVQNYVRQKFGDPILLLTTREEIPVSEIKIRVWWQPMDDERYGGIYRSRARHANGPETRLEIIVNRDYWRDYLMEAVVNEITETTHYYDEFSQSIINIFSHEYAHLEQDIKGQRSYPFTYLPQPQKTAKGQPGRKNKMRRYSPDEKINSLAYFARPAEIDAFATGAAAQVATQLMRSGPMSDQEWNRLIHDATAATPPSSEYYDYVLKINDLLATSPAKAKVLTQIKQRFLRTYVRRLLSYLEA